MTKNILLVATALLALGAAPAFAETAKMTPSPMSKNSGKSVHAKKMHHAKTGHHHGKSKHMHHARMGRSQNDQERAITRDLNRNAFQGT